MKFRKMSTLHSTFQRNVPSIKANGKIDYLTVKEISTPKKDIYTKATLNKEKQFAKTLW